MLQLDSTKSTKYNKSENFLKGEMAEELCFYKIRNGTYIIPDDTKFHIKTILQTGAIRDSPRPISSRDPPQIQDGELRT